MSGNEVPTTSTRCSGSMVASADQLATQAGITILAAGGNAVDAAIATNAVLAVTAPHLCGMGGDLYALVHDGEKVHALNATGRAGSGSDAAKLRRE
ncbi:MAG: gamma-glutamyltransferase, partial [Ilumatobacteraceae bacterium]